jgi:putative ABC transport system permease protein
VTAGRVPLVRRNLLADRRRLVVSAAGVGLAIMLMLLLDGLWAGIKANVSAYQDNVGADLYVAQPGTRSFLGAGSAIPADTVAGVQADPAVDWAVPVRGFYAIVELHQRKDAVYIVGSEPGERGGPWELATGRAPERDDEAVIGEVMASRHGLAVGDGIDIMGRSFEVVGTGPDGFMVSFVFMTHDATDDLLLAGGTTGFVLVGTDDPAGVSERLEPTGLAVLHRDELAEEDVALVTRAFDVPLGVMRSVAFGIGSLVIALTAYTAIADRRREYGIVKALGARGRHLVGLALRQTMMIAAVGLVAGGVLFLGGRALVEWWRPQFLIVLTPGSVGRAVVAAALMGAVAAVVPARRLAKLEPATAYRGG